MSNAATYRVTHTTIKHSGKNYLPDDLIALGEADARTLLKGGFIAPACPADAPPLPVEPDAPSRLVGEGVKPTPRKGVKV
ncbi:MAG: hypothetical protein AB1713_01075 [Pseudomonadota bacterium]